jgi:hypothetical protein
MHRSHEAWSRSFLLLSPADTGPEGSYLLRPIATDRPPDTLQDQVGVLQICVTIDLMRQEDAVPLVDHRLSIWPLMSTLLNAAARICSKPAAASRSFTRNWWLHFSSGFFSMMSTGAGRHALEKFTTCFVVIECELIGQNSEGNVNVASTCQRGCSMLTGVRTL